MEMVMSERRGEGEEGAERKGGKKRGRREEEVDEDEDQGGGDTSSRALSLSSQQVFYNLLIKSISLQLACYS